MSVKKRDLVAIEKELIQRRNEIEEQLKALATEKVTDDQVQDPGDQALSATMEILRNSLQDTELMEYNRIIQALEKLKAGTYGICIDCGEDISEKRLKSYPNAARCILCQEAFEERT